MAHQQRPLGHGSVDRDSLRGLPEARGGPGPRGGEPGAADASGRRELFELGAAAPSLGEGRRRRDGPVRRRG
eukprot:8259333-Pyramimonas_sp.AAC.1